MGFNDDKKKMIEALRQGRVLHEARSYQEDKNMLATDRITEEVALKHYIAHLVSVEMIAF